ncbi:hypothetical protein C8R46DRAFT_1028170 [Mycena filopes]|nr:hypothetical protein C8R46DRAFT_1028170 [Mycena filopes]
MSLNNATVVVNLDGPDSERWGPSMPNSDLFTLSSARDAARLIPEMKGRIVPRRVFATPTSRSPLGIYPPWTAPMSVPTAGPASVPTPAASSTPPLSDSVSDMNTPPSTQPLPQSRSAIGLGHPSTSKRRNLPLESDVPASSSTSATPRPRINSSTIKRRTERFPGRELHAIVEEPVTEHQQQPSASSSRPGPGTRKRSYAMAVSAPEHTGRRVTPTRPPSSPALPSTGSPRCASKPPSNAFVSSTTALASRYTASGAPQAGPTQAALDSSRSTGAVMAITKATKAEDEVEVEERQGGEDSELLFYEDGFIKFKMHTRIRIRVAAKRLSMLF